MNAEGIDPPALAAICNNLKCGTIWLTKAFAIGGGAGTIKNCIVHPCPSCGGRGRIPDGVYSRLDAKLFDPNDLEVIQRALNELHKAILSGASAEKVDATISEKYPFLSVIKTHVSEHPDRLSAYVTLISTLILTLSQCSSPKQGPSVPSVVNLYVQSNTSEVISSAVDGLKTSPPTTHKDSPPSKP